MNRSPDEIARESQSGSSGSPSEWQPEPAAPPAAPTTAQASAERALSTIAQDLQQLQQDLVLQLAQDVARLQAEKHRLTAELDRLRQERALAISSTPSEVNALPPEDRQAWVAQLAKLLASHLEEKLALRLESGGRSAEDMRSADPLAIDDRVQRSVETSFSDSYRGVTQDLSTQSSSLSRQLHQIQDLQQQGETILDALVSRMGDRLRDEVLTENATGATGATVAPTAPIDPTQLPAIDPKPQTAIAEPPPAASLVPPAPASQAASQAASQTGLTPVQLGLALALAYAAVLSVFNVSIKVILSSRQILPWLGGGIEWGGIISPSVGNSILILLFRMIVVLALMPTIAARLFPQWPDQLREFLQPHNRTLQYQVFGSGLGLFLSQLLIYVALGQLPTAVAITMFFIFPIATVLGAWALFGAKPTAMRLGILLVIFFGVAMSNNLSAGADSSNLALGSACAIGSGLAFAGYVLLTQACGKRLHPISFSIANFSVVLVLSLAGCLLSVLFGALLPAGWSPSIPEGQFGALFASCLWLGLLTLVSYVLNNFAIRYAGASLASIVGATGPVLTGLFAAIAIGEKLTGQQILGMFIVTFGVVSLSLERMYLANREAS